MESQNPVKLLTSIRAVLLGIIFLEIYKFFFDKEWDTIYVLIISIICYSLAMNADRNYTSSIRSSNKEDMIAKGLKFISSGRILALILAPFSFYCFFYKGLYGLYQVFSDFDWIHLVFRLFVISFSYKLVDSLAFFTPKNSSQFLEAVENSNLFETENKI